MTTRHTAFETELGSLVLIAGGDSITGLYFRRHARRPPARTFGPSVPPSDDALLSRARRQLEEYLEGERRAFDLPLRAAGDKFQRSVWSKIEEIPFGRTTTYGQIAAGLGDRRLAQRVGAATGANPIALFVPCHRVVGANGALTGYAGGLDRKRALLDLEEAAAMTVGRLF